MTMPMTQALADAVLMFTGAADGALFLRTDWR
jgi:hypothetical protein